MSQKPTNKLYAGDDLSRVQGQPLRIINPQEDPLTWSAVYGDETVLWECNPGGHILHTYRDINRDALKYFRIYQTSQVLNYWKQRQINDVISIPIPKVILAIELDKGKRLIWRQRRQLIIRGAKKLPPIYLAGWQMTFNVITEDGSKVEKSIKAINYLYPDGTIVLADRKTDIELREYETPTLIDIGDASASVHIIEPTTPKV